MTTSYNVQRILFGVTGQELYWDAPEGLPSSVTSVEVFEVEDGDDGTAEAALSGAAAIDATATTVSVASAVGDLSLSVASEAGFVLGRRYVVEAANQGAEWFEVRAISTGLLQARVPFFNAYGIGAAVRAQRITHAIDATWVADSGNLTDGVESPGYRVRWVYVVGGVTRVHDAYFDLTRYSGQSSVTPADVMRMFPSWPKILPDYHQQDAGQALIDEAEIEVRHDLKAIGIVDWQTRDREITDRLVMHKAVAMLQEDRVMRGGVSPEAYELARVKYETRLDQMFRVGSRVRLDHENDGSSDAVTPLPITVR